MDQRQKRMVGHAAIIMLLALAAGFGLVMSLIGGFEVFPGKIISFELPGTPGAWARTHAGGLMNGLMIMVVALLMWGMKVPESMGRHLYWMLVGTGYANTLFYWGGLLSPSRALTFGDNRLGESSLAGILGLFPALLFGFITMAAMIMLARHAFSQANTSD